VREGEGVQRSKRRHERLRAFESTLPDKPLARIERGTPAVDAA
jgi:hypothetical protein